jgi:hypothetical protein
MAVLGLPGRAIDPSNQRGEADQQIRDDDDGARCDHLHKERNQTQAHGASAAHNMGRGDWRA